MPKPNKKGIQVPPKGSKGWLITCDIKKDQQAVKQITGVLNHLADPIEEEEKAGEEKKEMSLEEELAALAKTEPKKKRWVAYTSEVQGNVFIRFTNDHDDPFELLQRYFDEVKETKKTLSDKISKIYPIQASGFPKSDESLPILKELIDNSFKADEPVVYEIAINRKHCEKQESHDELNDKILKLVGPPHKPAFKNAQWGVIWHSLGRNLYMSVVPKWGEWAQCNIAKFCANLLKPAEEAPKEESKPEEASVQKE